MTSGEVLFILAFIVLPTAILVSSIWAVIFVRRRPDRMPPRFVEESASPPSQVDHTFEQTAVIPAVDDQAKEPLAAETAQPADEVEEEADEPDDDEWREQDVISVPEDLMLPEPDEQPVAATVIQNTDDLGDVVTAIAALDDAIEPDSPSDEVLVEESDEPAEINEDDIADAEDDMQFVETSELPVISTDEDPEPPVAAGPQEDEPSPERASHWRRRKAAVKLRPADPDVPKHRARKGEPSRQVPQLSRSFRRRDDTASRTPPEPEADQESSPGRE